MALNDKFIRLQSGELPLRNRQVALSPELTAGKDLLDKILEPMKGKTVLIDVWGTWCAPCRNALKDFREEEEYLRKYDIAYLFLANRSPETSWKKIISDLAIDGDNVYHYNLPEAQQTAIEQYLGVRSFPHISSSTPRANWSTSKSMPATSPPRTRHQIYGITQVSDLVKTFEYKCAVRNELLSINQNTNVIRRGI